MSSSHSIRFCFAPRNIINDSVGGAVSFGMRTVFDPGALGTYVCVEAVIQQGSQTPANWHPRFAYGTPFRVTPATWGDSTLGPNYQAWDPNEYSSVVPAGGFVEVAPGSSADPFGWMSTSVPLDVPTIHALTQIYLSRCATNPEVTNGYCQHASSASSSAEIDITLHVRQRDTTGSSMCAVLADATKHVSITSEQHHVTATTDALSVPVSVLPGCSRTVVISVAFAVSGAYSVAGYQESITAAA